MAPKLEVLFFYILKKRFVNETDISQGHVQKGLEGYLLHSPNVVYRDPLCPTPSPSSALKIPEDTEEDPDDLRPPEEGVSFHSLS